MPGLTPVARQSRIPNNVSVNTLQYTWLIMLMQYINCAVQSDVSRRKSFSHVHATELAILTQNVQLSDLLDGFKSIQHVVRYIVKTAELK